MKQKYLTKSDLKQYCQLGTIPNDYCLAALELVGFKKLRKTKYGSY